MNAMTHMDEICRRVVEAYRKAYGDDIEAIYLYGSYARGDLNFARLSKNFWRRRDVCKDTSRNVIPARAD